MTKLFLAVGILAVVLAIFDFPVPPFPEPTWQEEETLLPATTDGRWDALDAKQYKASAEVFAQILRNQGKVHSFAPGSGDPAARTRAKRMQK